MVYKIGFSKKSHSGIFIKLPELISIDMVVSEKTKSIPPLAFTSSRLDTSFSTISLSGARAITGIFSSIRAKGPCLSSPAGYASACIYDISLSFSAPSLDIG